MPPMNCSFLFFINENLLIKFLYSFIETLLAVTGKRERSLIDFEGVAVLLGL